MVLKQSFQNLYSFLLGNICWKARKECGELRVRQVIYALIISSGISWLSRLSFHIFRLPIASITPLRIAPGISSAWLLIIWSVFGGIILHAFNCNFLSILVSPSFEKPLDSSQDIYDAGLIPIVRHSGTLKTSSKPVERKLAEQALTTEQWQPTDLIFEKVLWERTHAWLINAIPRVEFLPYEAFHTSKGKVGFENDWCVWLVNKKWNRKESLEKHILRFQQVYFQ